MSKGSYANKEGKFRCPFCKRLLSQSDNCKYETLSDHVSNPNAIDLPMRPSFICYCDESEDCFWDVFGDFYASMKYYRTLTQGKKKNVIAIHSPAFYWNRDKIREKRFYNRFFAFIT